MAENKTATVKINGTDYNLADLSDNARNQLTSIRVTEGEIRNLESRLAIAKTALAAYQRALVANLPKQDQ